MNRRLLSLLAGLLLVGSLTSLTAQSNEALREDLRRMVRYLSGDELEGRRTGTRGNLLAAGYIAGEFAEAGLMPLEGKYLHDFDYTSRVEVDPESWASIRPAVSGGGASDRALVLGEDYQPFSFTEKGDVYGDLVFVGYGISAPDEGYDDYAGIDVTGKVVLMMRYSPDGDNIHGALGIYAELPKKALTARQKGAAGMVVVDMDEGKGVISSGLIRGFQYSGLGAISVDQSVVESVRDGELTLSDIQKMIDETGEPHSFLVHDLSLSFNAGVVRVKIDVPNVLGMIPGTDPSVKDEIIVVGAHFDHLGHGGAGSLHDDPSPVIHNGADDNASGTSAVIALARRVAERGENRRTMIFMAFNGEEEGLLGSAHLMHKEGSEDFAPFAIENVVTMINLDMIGRMENRSLVTQGIGTSDIWESLVREANALKGGGEELRINMVPDGYGPSDHSSFYGRKIPVLAFFTGLHSDYHRPSDDWELVNFEGMVSIVNLVDNVARRIDQLAERPAYINVPRRSQGGNVRLKVVLGIVPDYGFGGEGLRITGVNSGGAGDKGGMQSGDIIVSLNGKEVNGIHAYMDALGSVKPHQEVEYTVKRGDKLVKGTVKPSGR